MFGFTATGATEVLYRYMLPFSTTFVLPWNSPGKNSEVGLPDTGIEPQSPALRADSLLSEPQGKPS